MTSLLKAINCRAIAHCSHTAKSASLRSNDKERSDWFVATGLKSYKLKPKHGGFTLVEFIIYIAILATILILISGFLWTIVLGNIKETSYREVQQNGRFALTKISQGIKKATGIISPTAGNSDISLYLQMADPSLNPTIFEVDNGKLITTQGTSGSYELTTDQVIVSSLQFTNLSYENTPGTIKIEMQIDHINPGNRMEYQASVNLKSSISLLPGGAAVPSPAGYCTGTPTCFQFDQITCATEEGCSWTDAYCDGTCTPCEELLDKKTCNTQAGCNWSSKDKICLDAPGCTDCTTENFPDQTSCEDQLGCVWSPAYCSGTPTTPCEGLNEADCTYYGCTWATE